MLNLKNNTKSEHSILSATKPEEPILDLNYHNKHQQMTKLKQKKRLKVYIQNNHYYVEHSTAYALGLVNTRAIMLDTPKLIEISPDIHNRLKSNDELEIEYIKTDTKEKIQVFVDDGAYCIAVSTAYALGLLTEKDFFETQEKYYYIDKDFLEQLKNSFDVEIWGINMALEEHKKSK